MSCNVIIGDENFPSSESKETKIPNGDANGQNSNVKQRLYRTSSFRKEYMQEEPEPLTCLQSCKKHASDLCCGTNKKKTFQKLLPLLRIYRKYKVKSDLPNDVISGVTVGIMQLPQGMAYAMLADLPPVVGLYMAFFPVIIYFIFGTSRQISMGTVAVVSLMIGSVVSNIADTTSISGAFNSDMGNNSLLNGSFMDNMTTTEATTGIPTIRKLTDHEMGLKKIALASSICFLVGVIQIVFGFLRFGFVTTYMSDPLVSGFTTGAAVHVFTSQVKYIFGLKIPRFGNMFQIIFTYKAIITNITSLNPVTVIISAICIVILYIVKVQINQRFKSKLKIPVPIELIVVIIGTVISHFFHFEDNYKVKIVGEIPAGLPTPALPSFSSYGTYFSDAIIIAVVAFAQSVSLAALMAKKHMYTIDANQEFIAYGIGNVFGSFFSCYPFAASVSRSSVQDSAGGRTQIASLFSASLVLIVIIVIGPLFESLPNCVLSSIIVVALRSMFLQVFELKHLWKVSKYDCMIWIVTFSCVVLIYVDLGLWIGLIFSFLTVVIRSQRTKVASLQKISSLDVFADDSKYIKTTNVPGIRVIGFNSPLYYANGDIFVKQVFQLVGIKPERARKVIKRLGSISEYRRQSQLTIVAGSYMHNNPFSSYDCPTPTSKTHKSLSESNSVSSANSETDKRVSSAISTLSYKRADLTYCHHLVIDCSSMCFVDTVGSKVLKQVIEEYKTVGVVVFLAAVREDVWQTLIATGFIEKYEKNIYLSVHDAVAAATAEGEGDNDPLQPKKSYKDKKKMSAIQEDLDMELEVLSSDDCLIDHEV
ncbi:hypothetical protein FSP39_001159 [Pinctada imbricata]|uniref:STAS domain-containing protein n=1 Tax=Pinctada imbricata TaxID=66713 RepID=A0AA88Y5Y4_PINIB|nr:hypothetical protein FSP39_001159 [Pinctada imbricata]